MKGEVEIYYGYDSEKPQLVASGSNLIVDLAAKTIVDAMTVPAYLSSVPSASSILDASNYTIHAMSFATTPFAFVKNMHDSNDSVVLSGLLGIGPFSSKVWVGVQESTSEGGSFVPEVDLPSEPKPTDTKLEPRFFDTPGSIPGKARPSYAATPNTLRMLGQHPNFLHYQNVPADKRINQLPDPTVMAGPLFVTKANDHFGAFPNTAADSEVTDDLLVDRATNTPTTLSTPRYSQLNTASAMDFRGFVRTYHMSQQTNSTTGVIVSSISTLSTTGEVSYVLTLSSHDIAFCNIYGGIYTIGLWALDLSGTLDNGVTPPFAWIDASGVTDREFQLFCKKSFTQNICKIQDFGAVDGHNSYSNCTIIWRLRFL